MRYAGDGSFSFSYFLLLSPVLFHDTISPGTLPYLTDSDSFWGFDPGRASAEQEEKQEQT